jgi:hypothetical protein
LWPGIELEVFIVTRIARKTHAGLDSVACAGVAFALNTPVEQAPWSPLIIAPFV